MSGTVRKAEAQYYSLACDQYSNGFARHCWEHLITGCGVPTDKLVKLQVRAAPRAPSSGWLPERRMGCRKQGGYEALLKPSHHHHHLNENIYSNFFFFFLIWVLFIVCLCVCVHNHSITGQQCLLADTTSYQSSCMCPNHRNKAKCDMI